jgi:hypothetical protein
MMPAQVLSSARRRMKRPGEGTCRDTRYIVLSACSVRLSFSPFVVLQRQYEA